MTIHAPNGLDASTPPIFRAHTAGSGRLRIAVMGTGHIGLVTAACLAELGHQVIGFDIDHDRVRKLQQGAMPIYEPGLHALLTTNQAHGRLVFSGDLAEALDQAELVFIAVGTPTDDSGATDLRTVTAAAEQIGATLSAPATVVVKSTVPVGSTDMLRGVVTRTLRQRGVKWNAGVVCNPEFLREGSAAHDFLCPDRILIGAACEADARPLRHAYARLARQGVPVIAMTTRSAELSKYAANAMLAARISLINEIAAIADATGADIEQVRQGIGSDPRIGGEFLKAGIGYGGSCFARDVNALKHSAAQCGVQTQILEAVEQVNQRQKHRVLQKMQDFYGGAEGLRGRRIALWGVTFKPGTDDLREAPSLLLVELLLAAGAQVAAYDPVGMPKASALLGARPGLAWCQSARAALEASDALLLVTEWNEFRGFPPVEAARLLRDGVVFDGRNVLDPGTWAAEGIRLIQIGRPVLPAAGARLPNKLGNKPHGQQDDKHDESQAAASRPPDARSAVDALRSEQPMQSTEEST
jgi:UDPglucose 6-dehydrogenase